MRYLTNILPEQKERALEAVRRSGLDIEVHNHPMPRENSGIDWERYNPQHPNIQHYLSVCQLSGDDATAFWSAWRDIGSAEDNG